MATGNRHTSDSLLSCVPIPCSLGITSDQLDRILKMDRNGVSSQVYDWVKKGEIWGPEEFCCVKWISKIQPVPTAVANADALDFLFSLFKS